MIKVNDALQLLERTGADGKHIPASVKFSTWNKEKKKAGRLHEWPKAHATGHRHRDSTETISLFNLLDGRTITVNTWLIFELNGEAVVL